MGRNSRKIVANRQRNQFNRNTKRIILLGLEGTNITEKLYFRNFNGRDNSYTIKFAKGNFSDPINITNQIINELAKIEGIDLTNGDLAYCVIDTDCDQKKNQQILVAEEIAIRNNIQTITSSPTFETWILCHFDYSTANMSNDKLRKW